MDIDERIKLALRALAGTNAKVVTPCSTRTESKFRPRKVSSIVRGKPKNEMSAKDRYRQCGKKVRYRSEHEARVHANNAETKRGIRLRVYGPCPVCGGWHITKNMARRHQE